MNDQQIMSIALMKAKSLNSISEGELQSLLALFNIAQNGTSVQALMELKKTLSYVLLIERNYIQDYLYLSKFNRISRNCHTTLIAYFAELWELFRTEKIAIDNANIKSFHQVKTPMEKLTKAIDQLKASDHRPVEAPLDFQRYHGFFPKFEGNPEERRINYPPNPMHSYMYPYHNFMNSSVFPPEFSSRGSLFDKMAPQNKSSDISGPANDLKRPLLFSESIIRHPMEQGAFKQEEFSQSQFSDHIQPTKGCFCGQSADQTLIKCQECSRQFHFKCWQSQNNSDAICPFCKVTYHHFYTKVVGKPILQRCSLTDQQFYRSKKILLNEEEMKTFNDLMIQIDSMSQDKPWIQLRVLKINKEQNGPKGFKSCFTLSGPQLRKIQERKWLELKFKNITIGDCLVFVLVCVNFKDLVALQEEVTKTKKQKNTFARNWLIAKSLRSYKINPLHPKTNLPIKYPMRGPRCEHVQCEQLSFIYEQGIKKEGRVGCSFCYKEYTVYEPFEFDTTIFEAFKKQDFSRDIELNLSDLLQERKDMDDQQNQSQNKAKEGTL